MCLRDKLSTYVLFGKNFSLKMINDVVCRDVNWIISHLG